jgi:hypothetical protein
MVYDGRLDLDLAERGSTHLKLIAVGHQQDASQVDLLALFGGQPVDLDHLTLNGFVLLAAALHNRVSHHSLQAFSSPNSLRDSCILRRLSGKLGLHATALATILPGQKRTLLYMCQRGMSTLDVVEQVCYIGFPQHTPLSAAMGLQEKDECGHA